MHVHVKAESQGIMMSLSLKRVREGIELRKQAWPFKDYEFINDFLVQQFSKIIS